MINVFIADDHQVVRDGLKTAFQKAGDIAVSGEAASGSEVLRRAAAEDWDILVLDAKLPDTEGIELLGKLKIVKPNLKVIIFTMYPEDVFAARFYQAGAAAFINKDRPPSELIEAVRKVAAGGIFITSRLAETVLQHDLSLDQPPHKSLSDRELEIFMLLAQGKKPKDIAKTVKLSSGTISSYISRIKSKLSVESLGEIVQYAYRYKLIE